MTSAQVENYSREAILKILRVSRRQLTAWQKQGLVSAGPYTFSDLIALKTILKLRQNKVPASRIQRSIAALKRKLVQVTHPLSELKIGCYGHRLIVNYQGAEMQAETGQFLFNFDTRRLEASVRAFQTASGPATDARRKSEAEEWFMKGLELEEAPETIRDAAAAYAKAIELNPEAAGAYINLGTIHYNQRRFEDAEKCYLAAIQIDPRYSLALFNLGNVYDEQGKLVEARRYYEGALQVSPNYADAHYNLALVYERLAMHSKAVQHWRAYLKLDPVSPWAAYARQQLSRNSPRIVPPENPPAPKTR